MDAGRVVVQPRSLLLLLLLLATAPGGRIEAKDEAGEASPSRSARVGNRRIGVIVML